DLRTAAGEVLAHGDFVERLLEQVGELELEVRDRLVYRDGLLPPPDGRLAPGSRWVSWAGP
ncbi:MAG TPA: hypothetical protein VGC37_06830, partial [Friedmanniella sp.]